MALSARVVAVLVMSPPFTATSPVVVRLPVTVVAPCRPMVPEPLLTVTPPLPERTVIAPAPELAPILTVWAFVLAVG